MIPLFTINVGFFTFIFLMTKILYITNLIINYRIDIIKVLLLLLYSTPYFLIFVIPMSVMTAILLTFLRINTDREIIALKSGGIGVYNLLPPVLMFCLTGCLLTGFCAIYGLPWGRFASNRLVYELAASNLNTALKERMFNEGFENIMLYVEKIDLKNNTLKNVFIEDQQHDKITSTIIAAKGELLSSPKNSTVVLRLFNGTVNQVNIGQKEVNSVFFENYELRLNFKKDINSLIQLENRGEKEMSLKELSAYLQSAVKKDVKYYKMLIEFHNKFSIPFACFALGILAVPLGLQSKSGVKSYGIGLSLVFFLLYYLLLSLGWTFGETGYYPPFIGLWIPNIVMGGLGAFLLNRTTNELPVDLSGITNRIKRYSHRIVNL
jgi:lipopolysaccharide export system permease protein